MTVSNNNINEPEACPICNSNITIKYIGHPGYQEGNVYDIAYCQQCNTSFAIPLEINEDQYNIIYSKREILPGYQKYHRYSEKIIKLQDPLKYISDQQDVYWAVIESIKKIADHESKKIIEIGCGLGFLTYALSKNGLCVQGIDLSLNVIEDAKKKYGNFYICADIMEYYKGNQNKYDIIIITEVIEHIPNVKSLFLAMDSMLMDGGKIILTTPNKSVYPNKVLWETEPPPIHLWWFSEKTIEVIAKQLNYSFEFVDFSEFNKKHYKVIKGPVSNWEPTRKPRINKQGEVIRNKFPVRNYFKYILEKINLLNSFKKLRYHLCSDYIKLKEKSESLCVILTKL